MKKRTTYLSYTDIRKKRRRRILCACVLLAAAAVGSLLFFAVKYLGTAVETGNEAELQEADALPADAVQAKPESTAGTDGWTPFSQREDRVKVKGIYVTGPMAGSSAMDDLIRLIDETELNAVVIDVKNDEGNITYQMELQEAQDMGACVGYIGDMDGLMEKLKAHNIYTIARIVCFKEPCLAKYRPELALKKADGSNLTDAYGLEWVNPYEEGVWEYLTDVALAAADAGFDEIQYDYVRFPIGSDADSADYGVDMQEYPKEQAITDFLNYAAERLHGRGVPVTADVFGTIIGSSVDVEQVGQNYARLGGTVDVLCPMIYPSHYGNHVFGLEVPDAHPYEAVYAALEGSKSELDGIEEGERAVVRPWLQAFTATWVTGHISYGGEQIRQQIQAVYDAGYEEWILWNAANRYSEDGLEKPESLQTGSVCPWQYGDRMYTLVRSKN